MATGLLEVNEIRNMEHGRCGPNGFIDENAQQFANLFGSKKRKQSIKQWQADETAVWSKYPMSNCEEVQQLINALNIAIQGSLQLIASNPSRADYPPKLEIQQGFLTKAKQAQSQLGCVEAQQAQQSAQESQQTLSQLQQLENAGVQAATTDIKTVSSSISKNIYWYAGGAVLALLAVGIAIKKHHK